jgi:hypothetical protein
MNRSFSTSKVPRLRRAHPKCVFLTGSCCYDLNFPPLRSQSRSIVSGPAMPQKHPPHTLADNSAFQTP